MTPHRLTILTIGPCALIAGSYALSFSSPDREQAAYSAQVIAAEQLRVANSKNDTAVLAGRCEVSAALLQDKLRAKTNNTYSVAMRAPFILAGDMSGSDLERAHDEILIPAVAALRRCYFDVSPDQPVQVILLRDEARYKEVARVLDQYSPDRYAGYYQRTRRRIVVNLATGAGTLLHELVHALAQFDFPDMPEWFDEGLASLHEEVRYSEDGLRILGVANWRCRTLHSALCDGDLPSLKSILMTRTIRGEGEGLHYAVARGLCRYLQDRDLLTHFYRKFRATRKTDPTGVHTLCEVLGVKSPDLIDEGFRDWISRDSLVEVESEVETAKSETAG